jgi:hypothetical protein
MLTLYQQRPSLETGNYFKAECADQLRAEAVADCCDQIAGG